MRMYELINESKPKFSLSDLDWYLQHPEELSNDEFEREFGMTRAQAEQEFGGSMPHDDESNMDIDSYINQSEVMPDSQFKAIFGISRAQAKLLPTKGNKRWTDYGDPIHE